MILVQVSCSAVCGSSKLEIEIRGGFDWICLRFGTEDGNLFR